MLAYPELLAAQNLITMSDKNAFFDRQLNSVVKEYPNLQIKVEDGTSLIKGILDIPDDNGDVAGCFAIEIRPSPGFPYAFPELYEVGGEIPCEADWHKYSDNSCCLTVQAKERMICYNGITLVWFIKNIAIPYFANQLYKKQTGSYLQEYSHGRDGIKEFYEELFQTSDINVWKCCRDVAFSGAKYERNGKCYCNSGKKYKKCHLPIEDEVRMIGKQQIMFDFKMMNLI